MQDDYPLPDDGEAEEARLREQERAELDAQASEDAELIGHAQDARDALEPHEADAEELGFALAWWDKAVLKQIFDARPDGTEDEMKSMEDAAIELAKEQLGSLGVEVVGLDEFIEKAENEEQRRRDAGLN